jgi:hypothetical protein
MLQHFDQQCQRASADASKIRCLNSRNIYPLVIYQIVSHFQGEEAKT